METPISPFRPSTREVTTGAAHRLRIVVLDLGAEWRGGQVQTLLAVTALARRGHRVLVAARAASPLVHRLAGRGIACVPVRGRGEVDPRGLLDVRRVVEIFAPDVIYASDPRGHGAAVWSASVRVAPLVVHRRVAFLPGRDPLSRFKYRAARRVLAVSEVVAATLRRAGVRPERIALVPVAIDARAFAEDARTDSAPFVLAHVGAFDGRKGQDVVVCALERLVADGVDVRAVFLGEGARRPTVELLARRRGVAVRCAFQGLVENVPEQLARAHLLLLPSASEGAPVVVLEALAAGCPALVHGAGGAAEALSACGAGEVIDDLEPQRWAGAIRTWLDDRARRLAAARDGRAWVGERSIDVVVERLEAELATATEEKPE